MRCVRICDICYDALHLIRFQTIDPAQFAAYNSVECVVALLPHCVLPFHPMQRWRSVQVDRPCGA
jgi:hypothetical protein